MLPRKIGVFLAGLCVGAALVEAGLALTGAAVLRWQALRRDAGRGDFRILCLGDSTTAPVGYDWPTQLEEVLRERGHTGVQVINEAYDASTSNRTADALPVWLDRYRPDLVVAMLGANDPAWTEETPARRSGIRAVWERSHVARLLRLAAETLRGAAPDERLTAIPDCIGEANANALRPRDLELCERQVRAAARRFPASPRWLWRLADVLELRGRSPEARQLRARAWALTPPGFVDACRRFAALVGPRAGRAPIRSSSDCLERLSTLTTIARMRAAQQLQPGRDPSEGEALCLAGLRVDPLWAAGYSCLAVSRLMGGEERRALPFARTALELAPYAHAAHDDGAVAMLSSALSKYWPEAAPMPEWLSRAALGGERVRGKSSWDITAAAYWRVQDLLRARGIPWVAMQYPTLPDADLRAIFPDGGPLVVENRENFSRALERFGYWALFEDRVETTWGHCTRKGHRLIAENLADALERAGLLPRTAGR